MTRGLPQSWEQIDNDVETRILAKIKSYFQNFAKSRFDFNIAEKLFKAFEYMNPDKLKTVKEMKDLFSLGFNSPIIIHIRQSNCMLVFHSDVNPDYVLVSVIQIYPTDPKLQVTDLKYNMITPLHSYKFPLTVIQDNDFIENLLFLKNLETTLDICQTKVKKGNVETSDDRYSPFTTAITEWLLPTDALDFDRTSPVFFKSVSTQGFMVPNKQIWRRSPLWVGLKASIHFLLTKLDPVPGHSTTLYKLIITDFLTENLDQNYNNLQINDIHELQLKLASRIRKLESLKETSSLINHPKFIEFMDRVMKNTYMVIDKLTKSNEQKWKESSTEWDKRGLISNTIKKISTEKESLASVIHGFDGFLQNLNEISKDDVVGEQSKPTNPVTKLEPLLNVSNSKEVIPQLKQLLPNRIENLQYDIDLILHTVENVVSTVLWNKRIELMKNFNYGRQLLEILQLYKTYALDAYKNDPKLRSKMILTCVAIVAIIDHIPSLNFNGVSSEIYYKHPPYMNIGVFDRLLLDHHHEYHLLNEIEFYFKNRFEDAIQDNEDLFSTSKTGFAYNWSLHHYQNQLKNLMDQQVLNRKSKQSEFEHKSQTIRDNIAKFQLAIKQSQDPKEQMKLITKEQKKKMLIHEDYLPRDEVGKHVLMYEKYIPSEFIVVTNAYAVLIDLFTEPKPIEVPGEFWIRPEKKNTKDNRIVYLGSLTKPFIATRYKKCKVFTSTLDAFIKPTDKRTSGFYIGEDPKKSFEIPKIDAWNLNSIVYTIPRAVSGNDSKKEHPLQWILNSSDITENQVIATQNICPISIMTPDQYCDFGIMRCGSNLQIRNIIRALDGQRLDFNQVETYLLIMQIIYQVGPNPDNNNVRPWKLDTRDPIITHLLVEIIKQNLDNIKVNWESKYSMLTFIKILLILLNTDKLPSNHNNNNNKKKDIIQCLIKCREISQNWMSTLHKLIQNSNSLESQKLKTNMVYACICSLLTFNFDMQDAPTETIDYIRSIVYLKANTMIVNGKISIQDNSIVFQQLISEVQRISLKQYTTVVRTLQGNLTILPNFISEYWNRGSDCIYKLVSNNSHCITYIVTDKVANEKYNITINLQNGEFLINFNPISRLPSEIENSSLYNSLFGLTILQVCIVDKRKWKTVEKYYNCHYEFFSVGKNSYGIKALWNNEVRYLVPSSNFKSLICNTLVNEYSHWYDQKNLTIEFRSKNFKSFHDPIKYTYRLKENLLESEKDFYLMNLKSSDFENIHAVFKPIESSETNLEVFQNIKTNQINVKLSCYNLDFTLSDGKIRSNQYPGYNVSPDQYLGTLIGFQSILVLIDDSETKKKVIIPNSTIVKINNQHINGNLLAHHHVTISTFQAQHQIPALFCYDVDNEFFLLRSNDILPQIFLSYLHAATSSTLPDPFTGLTGVESSIQALNHYQSNIPLSKECKTILRYIASLSPKRTCYHQFQNVEWNELLHPSIAYESFYLLTKHIINNNKQLKFLHFGPPKSKKKPSGDIEINHKLMENYYSLSIKNQSHLTRINDSILTSNNNNEPKFKVEFDRTKPIDTKCLSIKLMNHLPTNFSNGFVKFILIGSNKKDRKINGKQDNIDKINCIDFTVTPSDYYLTLYNLAYMTSINKYSLNSLKYLFTYLQWNWNSISKNPSNKHFTIPDGYFDSLACVAHRKISPIQTPAVHGLSAPFIAFNAQEIKNLIINHIKFENPQHSSLFFQTNFSVDNEYWEMKKDIGQVPIKLQSFPNHPQFSIQLQKLVTKWMNNAPLLESINSIDAILKQEKNKTLVNQTVLNSLLKYLFLPSPQLSKPKPKPLLKPLVKIQTLSNYSLYFLNLFDSGMDKEIENLLSECLVKLKPSTLSPNCQGFLHSIKAGDQMSTHIHEDLEQSLESLKKKLSEKPKSDLSAKYNTNLEKVYRIATERSVEVWNLITTAFQSDDILSKTFRFCGLENHSTKTSIFKYYLESIGKGDIESPLFKCIGSYILLRTYMNKVLRCQSGSKDDAIRELETSRLNRNWKPSQYPEWLMFELEQGIMIRDIQSKIAIDLMNSKENICTQLQMGEGKTSVILPLMCLALSRKNKAVRVNVLPSLLETSRDDIIRRMGGILNRKLYMFPYQRDRNFLDRNQVSTMLNQLNECKNNNGIILSTPEHTLSFQLKWKLKFEDESKYMIDIINWYNDNVYDILDECDELLSHKYQLVYPIGGKIPLDGDNQRWKIIQEILIQLKRYIFYDKAIGINQVVISNKELNSGFPSITILNSDKGRLLLDQFLEYVIKVKQLDPDKKNILSEMSKREILNGQVIDKLNGFNDNMFKTLALIYRGMFVYGVLLHCLEKIPTKDYGLTHNDRTKLAVPYRAKDTPSERAEYGHPDVALILTHLAYYNQGLTHKQFVDTLEYLIKKEKIQANKIYGDWIKEEINVPSEYKSSDSIVLSNTEQLNKLYKIFKFNILVINYYLSSLVLPYETKCFPEKLLANAWDISSEKENLTTIGFSGTNDTRCLLPLNIKQQDMEELKYTNFEVIHYVLSQQLPKPVEVVNKNTIMQKLISNENNGKKAKVLIDTGALMIGKSNDEVARLWLSSLEPSYIDGALFFENNLLTAIDRSGRKYPFHLSPFVNNLKRVVTYLDDYHTRGVDIKFPIDTHACVTVGLNLTKEKLLHGILRLRKFGNGQTISFLVSDQLNFSQFNQTPNLNSITPQMILQFVTKNTIQSNINAFQSWATQGIMYSQTHLATKLFQFHPETLRQLSSSPEKVNLEEMYGANYSLTELRKIIYSNSVKSKMKCQSVLKNTEQFIAKLHQDIMKETSRFVSEVYIYSNIGADEEQERECEIEQEREYIVQLPTAREPAKNKYSALKHLETLCTKPNESINNSEIFYISEMYKNTSISKQFGLTASGWDPSIRCSYNFIETITLEGTSDNASLDQYLKTPNYILVLWRDNPVVIFISSYEANYLLPILRDQPLHNIIASLHQVSPIMSNTQIDLLRRLHTPLPSKIKDFKSVDLIFNQITLLNGSKYFHKDNISQIYSILGVLEIDQYSLSTLLEKHPHLNNIFSSNGFIKKKDKRPIEIFEELWNKVITSKFNNEPFEFILKNLNLRRSNSILYSDIEKIIKTQ
ncbi:U3 snoRNP protein [Tieghemostelium lacteum]|uniref:ubiquitinyl hydrolase 1 n=1 Tax=Tieghemostelium lacteum TaxID=361077 RepID=A0A151ZF75_TIELA|nr:U3 snoRNP protein [Tieghemostelium lacteum]|eukprot:KYQ92585.1 U3 snoRNP protein [Tieghemostelium lacteum]